MKSSSSSNYHYNKRLSSGARELRRNMTKAEACLWKYVLRAGSMKGFTFRRQRPVLQYIADFMCKELELIIEVDGITHSYEEVAENDKVRQKALEDAGFTIIRYSDEEVLKHINSVRDAIEAEVIQLMKEKDITPRIRNRNR
uniref:endonuclease domain-containing protein n=1 Tax=Fulvivirga sp. TaxID=1931237 RepID=UPI004049BB57